MGSQSIGANSISKQSKEIEKHVLRRLLSEIDYLKQMKLEKGVDLWHRRMETRIGKFLSNTKNLEENIRNFRRNHSFIPECPSYQSLFPIHWLSGASRGQKRRMKDRLELLKGEKDLEFLRKYPINLVGNPYYFEMGGYRFNERWSRNIRFLSLAATYLGDLLNSGTAKVLDIGGGYGIFSGLLKREFKQIISGIVEFPEQLLVTYYYLAMNFPHAKINTLKEIHEVETIDDNFVGKYDFLLIPIHCYPKIRKKVFPLVTNFVSLAEMNEKWFNYYLDGDAFASAEYFFTVNRFASRPSYESDLSILDYKLHGFQKVHFKISPLFGYDYPEKYKIFTEKKYLSSQFFEFIGKRKDV